MKQALGWLVTVSLLTLVGPPAFGEDLGFKIVVSADHPIDSITPEELSKVFLRKQWRWADGSSTAPVDQKPESPARLAFTRAIHKRSVGSIKNFWQSRIFSGKATPPPELATDLDVLKFVEDQSGGVGYVTATTPLPPFIRVLEVEDLAGYDATALALAGGEVAEFFPHGSEDAEPDDETVSRHGDLHLFLTGSCGSGEEGREAVLENGSAYGGLKAQVEVSLWDDGWFRSSSIVTHTVDPLAEKRLGCTRGPGDRETRYAIVHASSAASHGTVAHGHDGPPRSAVDIVGSGTCGNQGSWQSVLSKHPYSTVAVSIRYVETQDGRVRRRFEKTHHLAPGKTLRLGCSRDGGIVRRFTILKASYR